MLDTLMALGMPVKALLRQSMGFVAIRVRVKLYRMDWMKLPDYLYFPCTEKRKKPTAEMLEDIDVLLFDMQDVGARFYTYNSTMKYVIEASAEQGLRFGFWTALIH